MKTCRRCNKTKTYDLFAKRSASKDGYAVWCKQCFAENAAAKYQNDPAERQRKSLNKSKMIDRVRNNLWQYLLEHPCVDCSNSDPRVLEFDHRDELLKKHNISEMFGWSWVAIQKEIDKCDVRCANCHRIRTQEQFGTWRVSMVV